MADMPSLGVTKANNNGCRSWPFGLPEYGFGEMNVEETVVGMMLYCMGAPPTGHNCTHPGALLGIFGREWQGPCFSRTPAIGLGVEQSERHRRPAGVWHYRRIV